MEELCVVDPVGEGDRQNLNLAVGIEPLHVPGFVILSLYMKTLVLQPKTLAKDAWRDPKPFGRRSLP